MAVVADTQRAVSVLQGLQGKLVAAGDPELGEQVAAMIDLLASPSFRHLLNLQQSVRQLKHHIETGPPGQTAEDFSFATNGELILPEPEADLEPEPYPVPTTPKHPYAFENKTFEGDEEAPIRKTEAIVAASAPPEATPEAPPEAPPEAASEVPALTRSISLERANQDLEQALRELALGREVVSIELVKPEGRGLGFSVVGLKSENQGELGIFVQQIQPKGVAARDGRLHESDQILAINGALVDSSVSHKQAIGMLQKVKDQVNLIVARGGVHIPIPAKADYPSLPRVPEVENEAAVPVPDMVPKEQKVPIPVAAPAEEPLITIDEEKEVHMAAPATELEQESMVTPDIEVIDLYNQGSGLGFGIVGVRDIGIVVKTIVQGGAAEKDGRLQSGDIILRIGDTDLEGMNSDQVANVLRQSGSHVRLVVARGALSVMQHPAGPKEEEARLPPQGLDLGDGQMEPELHPVSPPPVSLEHAGLEVGEVFEVELVKGSQGLGLSIAGFIKKTTEGETSGIFVKKIAEGSAADLNRNIKVGDQIIEVDGINVRGYDNKAAVDLLRRTGAMVHLRLVRFPPDVPREVDVNLQAQAAPLPDLTQPSPSDHDPPAIFEDEMPVAPSPFPPPDDVLDENVAQYDLSEENFEGDLSPEEEIAIMALWQGLLGLETDIVIAQLSKFHEGGSLGISLEGTVDIDEMGQEVQPHHYIRSILPDGPVGQNGMLTSGDELLEVNGIRLLGLNHEEVVKILKDLPRHVRLVCARHPEPVFPQPAVEEEHAPDIRVDHQPLPIDVGDVQLPDVSDIEIIEMSEVEAEISPNVSVEIQMAAPLFATADESETHLDVSGQSDTSVNKESSMWSDDIQYIELVKGGRGLGFSILDYQDPANPSASVIVIRSLVAGSVAEQDGRLIPGDRLVAVNESNLENCSLDMAVQVLKGAPTGLVRIGVAKPVSAIESEEPQVVCAQPAVVEEATPPVMTPPPDATTPMLPDVDISPLAAAITAKEAVEEAEVEMEAEMAVNAEMELNKIEEPSVVAAEVSLAHSAAPVELTTPPPSIQSVMPPDLVTSTTASDRFNASVAVPEPEPSLATPEALEPKPSPPEVLEKAEERLPKMVAIKATPPSLRKKSYVVLPSSLEQTIVLKNTNAGLGLTVSANKSNGVVIKSIIRGGCVQQDGRLSVGDFITGVNGENMRNLNNLTARGVLRRSFLQGTDITVTYIPVSTVTGIRENASQSSGSPQAAQLPVVPRLPNGTVPESPVIIPSVSQEVQQATPSPENQWGDVKTVSVNKELGRTLGISIVGGRAGDGQPVHGIYIKHVLEESPAGRTGMLKTGDRILEVNGCDLREATHDQAVAVIRNASNPMQFQVQSLTVGSPAAILPDDPCQGAVVAVAATVVQAGIEESDESMDRVPDGKEAEFTSDSESEDEFGYTWKKVSQRYEDLDGELHLIELSKGDRGLGLSLSGNKDRHKISVFVVGVNPSGAAGKDGRILIGDEILEINGIKVYGHSHQNASSIIQGLAPGVVKLILSRNPDAHNQLAVPPVIYPNQTSIPTVLNRPEPSETASHGAPLPALVEEEIPMPSPEDYPNVQTITLTKGLRGLGFAIYENRDDKGLSGIFVKDVTMGGPAAKEGHLRVGDQILAVTDKSLIGLSKLSAITVLKDTKGTVSLTISSAKPFPGSALSFPSLFPTLDSVAGAEGSISVTAQPIMAAELKTQNGHGNFFPALDLGEDLSTYCASTNLEYQPLSAGGTFFPELDKELDPINDMDSGSHVDSDSNLDSGSDLNLHQLSSSLSSLDVESSIDGDCASVHSAEASLPETRSDSLCSVNVDPLTCPVVKGRETLIVIDRGESGLGISIIGGMDTQQKSIMVHEVYPDGAAARDARLQAGDQLLEVDGLELTDVTHDDAINVLRQTAAKVRMVVLREDPPSSAPPQKQDEDDESVDIFSVVLHQPAGQSLGLSIAGRAGALYISDIALGSPADATGQMARGDQILSVNDQDVKTIPQEALATLRQNAEGNVSLKIARQKEGSLSSFETVIAAQPAVAEHSEQSTGSESGSLDAGTAFLQQQESFGSSTELPPEEISGKVSVKTVILERGPDGLGFSIVGGFGSPHGDLPIYIKTVFSKGAAAETKQLKRGDQILAVNGESLEGATNHMAVNMLKKARGKVNLTIVA